MDSSTSWITLPTEMKFTVMDNLSYSDLLSLSRSDSASYHASVPALFRSVYLKNYDAIHRFIQSVPSSYRRHIRHLDLCMLAGNHRPSLQDQANAVATLLTCCSRLEKLVLRMAGSMDNAILSAFPQIPHLRELAISNCLTEDDAPVSERLVVHIAASLPNLHTLTLDRISRSALHSSDITYSYPPIPRVLNDDDVPPHPLLGSQLNLPSLLLLPSLKKLSIKDTHLGDPQWEDSAHRIACQLEQLDLGGSIHESDERNGAAVQRIVKAAGSNLVELTLSTSLFFPSSSLSESELDNNDNDNDLFGNLSILRLSPYFPIENLEETLALFSGSPIHTVSYECFDMDAVEVCQALEDFLSTRVCLAGNNKIDGGGGEVGEEAFYYDHLRKIEVVVVQSGGWEGVGELWKKKQEEMQCFGVMKLVRYCRDLGLVAVVLRRRGTRQVIPDGFTEEREEEWWELEEGDGECCWDGSVAIAIDDTLRTWTGAGAPV